MAVPDQRIVESKAHASVRKVLYDELLKMNFGKIELVAARCIYVRSKTLQKECRLSYHRASLRVMI